MPLADAAADDDAADESRRHYDADIITQITLAILWLPMGQLRSLRYAEADFLRPPGYAAAADTAITVSLPLINDIDIDTGHNIDTHCQPHNSRWCQPPPMPPATPQ